MIKSVFVSPLQLQGIEKSEANHLIISNVGLNEENWEDLRSLGVKLGISLHAFEKGICPVDPQAKEVLFERLENALKFGPDEVWLDYFRFGGECTGVTEEDVAAAHKECEWCQGVDRVKFLSELVDEVVDKVNGKCKIGYFAVAFKDNKLPDLSKALGINYEKLGQSFDLLSPMLYHRMFSRPVNYISDYVKWLAEIIGKPVLPVIQIKDMPDDLEDNMTEEDITAEFREAVKEPSIGVCFFWWVHALEKDKMGIISRLFSAP